jgi:hypothetical protein
MAKELVTEIDDTYRELLKIFSLVPAAQIDTIPIEGSWTAGQLAEHLIRAGFSAGDFFRENVRPTEGRAPDAGVEQIKSIFLNFGTKLQAPSFIVPLETLHDKAQQIKELERIRRSYIDAVEQLDLSYTCLGRELPGAGYLTRLEWISLNVYHTQRHIRQLKKILAALQAKAKTPA